METWKEIHNGFYEVSTQGNLRRAKPGIATFIGRLVLPMASATGYMQVQLGGDEKRRAYVHHLVMEAFVGRRPDGMVVNHKDGNKQNNALENLEYITPTANSHHAIQTIGRRKGPTMPPRPLKGKQVGDKHWTKRMPERIALADRMPHSKMTPEMVAAARDRHSRGEKQKDLAAEYGVSVAQMSRIIRRTRWTHV